MRERFAVLRTVLFATLLLGLAPTLRPGASLAQDQRSQPAAITPLVETEVRKAVEYVKHDGVSLTGDLYVPKAAGKYPVIVAVHGGGWQAGNSGNYASWGSWLSARGYALFAINYRLSKPKEKTYPQAVHDLRAAIQFVKARATDLKIDPERIALMGDSAGAHLVSLVALGGDSATFSGAYKDDPHASVSTKVKAVVGAYGVYDMVQQYNHDVLHRPQDSIVGKFIGVPPWENRKLYFDASPMNYAESGNRGPSFFLAYGTEDDIVDRAQSDAFLIALKQAGFYARHAVLQGYGHFWMTGDPVDDPRGANAWLAPRVLRFFGDRL
jgi:acetyl esterase/lipase